MIGIWEKRNTLNTQDGNIDAVEIETMLRTNPALDEAEIDEFLKTFAIRWTKWALESTRDYSDTFDISNREGGVLLAYCICSSDLTTLTIELPRTHYF